VTLKQHWFLGNGPEQTKERRRLLGSGFIINKKKTTAAMEWIGKHVPAAKDTHATEERCFLHGLFRDVISNGQG
jgi:hypothetical protein